MKRYGLRDDQFERIELWPCSSLAHTRKEPIDAHSKSFNR